MSDLSDKIKEAFRVLRNRGYYCRYGVSGLALGKWMKDMNGDGTAGKTGKKQATNKGSLGIYDERPPEAEAIGLKPKDLVGIPWREPEDRGGR